MGDTYSWPQHFQSHRFPEYLCRKFSRRWVAQNHASGANQRCIGRNQRCIAKRLTSCAHAKANEKTCQANGMCGSILHTTTTDYDAPKCIAWEPGRKISGGHPTSGGCRLRLPSWILSVWIAWVTLEEGRQQIDWKALCTLIVLQSTDKVVATNSNDANYGVTGFWIRLLVAVVILLLLLLPHPPLKK